MNRETIVKNLLDDLKMWTRKLEEFDRAEAKKTKEVYVWLLREGKPEKVLVHDPCQMKAMFTDCPEIGYRLDVLPEFTCYPKDEGVTWFRSEAAALEAQEKAEEVWLLVDGKVERVKVDAPDFMEQCLRENGEYIFAPYCELIIHTKDEGVSWFRIEEAALEAQEKAEPPDALISLREAIKTARGGFCIHSDDAESLCDALNRLPRYPAPKLNIMPGQAFEVPPDWEPGDKLVSWEKVKGWFCNQYGDCYISDKFRKHLGIGPDE